MLPLINCLVFLSAFWFFRLETLAEIDEPLSGMDGLLNGDKLSLHRDKPMLLRVNTMEVCKRTRVVTVPMHPLMLLSSVSIFFSGLFRVGTLAEIDEPLSGMHRLLNVGRLSLHQDKPTLLWINMMEVCK
jgi:hypothetical protein